jgi:hypothetical protein
LNQLLDRFWDLNKELLPEPSWLISGGHSKLDAWIQNSGWETKLQPVSQEEVHKCWQKAEVSSTRLTEKEKLGFYVEYLSDRQFIVETEDGEVWPGTILSAYRRKCSKTKKYALALKRMLGNSWRQILPQVTKVAALAL